MGIFSDVFKRTDDASEVKIDATKAFNIPTGYTSSGLVRETSGASSAISITEDTAMKIGALNQGINIIADTIASMPIYLYKEENGFQQYVPNDPRSRALSGMANEVLTSFNLKRNLIKDLILYGNAYAKIVREKESRTIFITDFKTKGYFETYNE